MILDDKSMYVVKNFIYFTTNFPLYWFSKCFHSSPVYEHLCEKWTIMVKRNSDNGVIHPGTILKLFFELDDFHQQMMIRYITEEYCYYSKHKEAIENAQLNKT